MEQVVYFERAEMPGVQHFRCERLRASLATGSCAGMWRRANDGTEDRESCLRCPIGAVHAGQPLANLSPLRLGPICARCHNPARRLIGKMHCVSCKNREYEFLRGRNAKGTRPVKIGGLCRRRIRYTVGTELHNLVAQYSLDTEELVVAALRDSPNRVSFGMGALVPGGLRQLRLF